MTQMMGGISSQIRQLEQGAKRIYLTEKIGIGLRGACKENLNKKRDTSSGSTTNKLSKFVAKGGIGSPLDKIDFYQIVDENNSNLINLKDKDQTARLSAEYGIRDPGDPADPNYPKAHLVFQLLCNTAQPDGSTGVNRCKCDGSSQTYPCSKKWTARLVSQTLVNGLPQYDNNFGFDLDVSWTATPNTNYDNFNCSVSNQLNACYTVEELGNKRTLVGCGSTQNIGGFGTTAIGYGQAGGTASVSGRSNFFIGPNAGMDATVAGIQNTFLGRHAGHKANIKSGAVGNIFIGNRSGTRVHGTLALKGEISGTENLFAGHNAGVRATVSGGHNNFFGQTGYEAKVAGNGNIFIGYNAGRKANLASGAHYNTFLGTNSGDKTILNSGALSNTFVGDWAGREAKVTGFGNSFFGHHAGYKATIPSGSDAGVFIGYSAGSEATLANNTDGNTFLGYHAGHQATVKGPSNTFLGTYAGNKVTLNSGTHGNTFLGHEAGKKANITSNLNTFLGYWAGKEATMPTDSDATTFLGYSAGEKATFASATDGNTFLGYQAGYNTTFSTGADTNTFIGREVMRGQSISSSGHTYIGGSVVKIATGGALQKCNGQGGVAKMFKLQPLLKFIKKTSGLLRILRKL